MSFCPNCNSILDISKTGIKKVYNVDETPSEMSDTNEDKINDLIEKIIENKNVDNIENLHLDQITAHESFQKLDKQKRAMVVSKIESLLSRQDDTTSAYYRCKGCGYTEMIKTATLIATKIGTSSKINYGNMDKYKNKIYNRALPFTRRYICPNKDCIGNKDPNKHEAVMYRLGESMQMGYTCRACQSVFIGQ